MNAPALPPARSLVGRIVGWLGAHAEYALGTISAAVFAASGLMDDLHFPAGHWYSSAEPRWLAVVLGAVLLFAAGVSTARRGRSLHGLQSQVDALRVILEAKEHDRALLQSDLDEARNSIRRIMVQLCEQFGTAMGATTQERISVYAAHESVHDPEDNGFFVPLARRSANPNYEAMGRTKHPRNQGIIAVAWAHEHAISSYSRKKCPDDGVWAKVVAAATGIPKKTLQQMRMKSKVLLAVRIGDSSSGRPCAVLVYESTRYMPELTQWIGEDPVTRFHKIHQSNLGRAMMDAVGIASRLVRHIDPDEATREGF